MRERAHDREVVRDEEVGDALVGLQLAQQLDDARLHRDVERGEDLVAQHQPRPRRERPCDRDALSLAARELVREAGREGGVEPDVLERLLDAGAALLAVQTEEQLERTPHDLMHALARVERRVRVLEDELDLAPDVPRTRLDGRREAPALERDPAGERAAAARRWSSRSSTCRCPTRRRARTSRARAGRTRRPARSRAAARGRSEMARRRS